MNTNAGGNVPTVVMVGGFLGAGKTTLLLAAVHALQKLKLRSALIVNDQGNALVDSQFAELQGAMRREVTGGCFCCRFSDLATTLEELLAFSPDVIFAEPVGSCTDISATTLQPLRAYPEYALAPFTVLVDPERAMELLRAGADRNLKYLFAKQLEEADIICFTKSDLYSTYPDLSEFANMSDVRQLSAATGQGVTAWLDEVLSGKMISGNRILDIDYQQYAMAEAALVWLNLRVHLQVNTPIVPAALLGQFFDRLDADLAKTDVDIVHMKAIIQCSTGYVKAAITKNRQAPKVEGNLDASPSSDHELTLNLRALGAALDVQTIVEQNLEGIDAKKSEIQIDCFHPAAPLPQYRFSSAALK